VEDGRRGGWEGRGKAGTEKEGRGGEGKEKEGRGKERRGKGKDGGKDPHRCQLATGLKSVHSRAVTIIRVRHPRNGVSPY